MCTYSVREDSVPLLFSGKYCWSMLWLDLPSPRASAVPAPLDGPLRPSQARPHTASCHRVSGPIPTGGAASISPPPRWTPSLARRNALDAMGLDPFDHLQAQGDFC